MKSHLFAIGLAFAIMNVSTASASYLLSPYASMEERYQYESDHVAANRYHSENAQSAMTEQLRGRAPVKPFSDAERKWFNETPGYVYGNCHARTTWPC